MSSARAPASHLGRGAGVPREKVQPSSLDLSHLWSFVIFRFCASFVASLSAVFLVVFGFCVIFPISYCFTVF